MKIKKQRLSKHFLKPNYQIAKDYLVESIINEGYQTGDRLPSMVQLSKKFDLAKISVQKAVSILTDDGILKTIKGSGCYVNKIPEKETAVNPQIPDSDFQITDIYLAQKKQLRLGLVDREVSQFPELWQMIVDKYMKKTNDVSIELFPISNRNDIINGKVLTDIIPVEGIFLPYFVKNDFIYNPDELGPYQFETGEFYQELINAATFSGQIWAVPTLASSGCQFAACTNAHLYEAVNHEMDLWEYLEWLKWFSSTKAANNYDSLLGSHHNLFSYLLMDGRIKTRNLNEIKDNLPELCEDFLKRFAGYFRNRKIFLASQSGPGIRLKFCQQKIMSMMGSTYWLDRLMKDCPFDFQLFETPSGQNGKNHIDGHYYAISCSSRYPLECQDFLNFLASHRLLRKFAMAGRTTANQKANSSFYLKKIAKQNLEIITRSFDNGFLWQTDDPYVLGYMNTIVANEMASWQEKRIDSVELLINLERKTRFYYNGIKRSAAMDISA